MVGFAGVVTALFALPLTLTRKIIPTLRPISIGESKPAIKYPDLVLVSKMSFIEQIKAAADRAAAGVSALVQVMTNIESPTPISGRLLISTTQGALFYAAEVWANALSKKVHRRRLTQVQRCRAFGVASAYRTILELAVGAISGLILVALRYQMNLKRSTAA